MKGERKEVSPGKRLRHRLEAAVLRALAWLVPKFSRRFARRLGGALGSLAYALSSTLRRISLENLDVAFGDTMSNAEKRRVARAGLANAGATLLALFWSPRLTREWLDEFVDLDADSFEHLRGLKAQGKPIVFVTLHYGDWELLGQATGFYGLPLTIVQARMKNEALEEILARLRSVSGHRLVPNRFAATTLLKTLKRGGNIALLIDLNATRKRGGVWLDFFGLPAFSNAAVGALVQHTGAAVVGGIAIPMPDGRVRLTYTEIEPGKNINQSCLQYCERVIREHPDCWMWSYKRWTPRATPEQGRYPAYSRYVPDIAPHPPVV